MKQSNQRKRNRATVNLLVGETHRGKFYLPLLANISEDGVYLESPTGLEMPRVEDWDSPDFRVFVKWRYDFFGDYWRSLCDHVRSKSEHGLVCLNHFQRLHHRTGFGGPLNHLDIDGLVTAEVDQAYYQNIMK